MLFQFSNVLIFLLVGAGFVFISLLLSSIVRPKVPNPRKLASYECGEIPTGDAWTNFNMRFYLLALLFIIFDVEIAFMFPVGAVFREWIAQQKGHLALLEIVTFVLILVMGLVYAWVKGDLEWIKNVEVQNKSEGTEIVPPASQI